MIVEAGKESFFAATSTAKYKDEPVSCSGIRTQGRLLHAAVTFMQMQWNMLSAREGEYSPRTV